MRVNVLFIEDIENQIKKLNLDHVKKNKKRQGVAFYINIETDLNKLKNELEEIQNINIKNYVGHHKTFFKMELEYMEECHQRFKQSDFIINNGVAVPITKEHEKISKEIINKVEELINELDLMEQKEHEKRKRKQSTK